MVSLRINLTPRLSFDKKSQKGKSEDSPSPSNRKSKGRSTHPSSPSPRSPYFTRIPPSSPRRSMRSSTAPALRVTLGPTVLRSNLSRRPGSAGNKFVKKEVIMKMDENGNEESDWSPSSTGKTQSESPNSTYTPSPTLSNTPRSISSLKSKHLRVAVPHRSPLSPKSEDGQPDTPGSAFMLDYNVKSPLSYAFSPRGNAFPMFRLDDQSTMKKCGSRVGGSMSERRTSMVDMMNKMNIQQGEEKSSSSLIVTSSTLSRNPPSSSTNRPLSIRVHKTQYTSYSSPSSHSPDLGSPTSTVSAGPILLPKLSPRLTSLSTRIQARRPNILDLALPSSPRSRRSSGHSVRTPLSAKFSSSSSPSVRRDSAVREDGMRSAPMRDMKDDVEGGWYACEL